MKGSALCFWIFNILIFHANLLFSMKLIKKWLNSWISLRFNLYTIAWIFRGNIFWLCKIYNSIRRNSFQFPRSRYMWKFCTGEPRNSAPSRPVYTENLTAMNEWMVCVSTKYKQSKKTDIHQSITKLFCMYCLMLGELFRGWTV